MGSNIIIGILQNVAILFASALIYDNIWLKNRIQRSLINKIVTGFLTGSVGILLMLTPWTMVDGIVFDTRSILLAISGLFFGPISTIIAMCITIAFRIYLGGSGAIMGCAVIITAGSIGILYNILRKKPRIDFKVWEIYLLGLIVHIIMLLCIFFLPINMREITLKTIIFPVLVIYPIGTTLLGYLMLSRLKHWKTKYDLKISEEKYRRLTENAQDIIFKIEVEPEVKITYLNSKVYEISGFKPEEFYNNISMLYSCIHPDDFEIINNISKSSNYYESFTIRCLDRFGKYHWLKTKTTKVVDKTNNKVSFEGISSDITEELNIYNALKESEAKYKFLYEYAGVGIGYYNVKGEVISFNEIACKNMGGNPSDFVGKSIFELFPLVEANKYMERITLAVNSEENAYYEDLIELPIGKQWFLSVFAKVMDNDNNVLGIQIISQDITSRKEAEIKLKEKNEELSKFNDLTVGREIRMLELKKEVNLLLEKLEQPAKYKTDL